MSSHKTPSNGPPVPETSPTFERLNWLSCVIESLIKLNRLRIQAIALERENPGDLSALHGFETDFLAEMDEMIRTKLGWRVTHNDDIPTGNEGDRYIYFGNHPTLTAAWPWGHFMSQNYAGNNATIAKEEVISNPFYRYIIGDTINKLNKGIFIKRNNKNDRKEAVKTIRRETARVLTPDTGGTIFVDEHRPYKSSIRKDRKYWSEKLPDLKVKDWLTETCFPRSGGLWALEQATHEMNDVRFLNSTIVEPSPTHRFGANLHIDVREISREELFGDPPNPEHLQIQLVRMWMAKNELIRSMRG